MNHPPPPSPPLIAADALSKVYKRGVDSVRALDSASFAVDRGEFTAVVGHSGSGKTTLLSLLGCMDTPTSGSLRLDGREVQNFTDSERTAFRRDRIGFVFQHFGLLPTLTVAENVALPRLFARKPGLPPVDALLERVGIRHRRRHRPNELSGGEMQRVAIARALSNEPTLLLADEPTGNLDETTGASIIGLFRELNAAGLTVVVVTHNSQLAAAAQRQLRLSDGRLI